MRCLALSVMLALCGSLVMSSLATSQDKKDQKKQDVKKDDKKKDEKKKGGGVFTDPKEAGPDYEIQGEYAASSAKYAAQVVALGDGAFDVYFLAGGLPGAGWDTRTRVKVPAKTVEGKVILDGMGWTGAIVASKLEAKSKDGDSLTLSKVERESPTIGKKAPPGAVILFDGTTPEHWSNGKIVEGNLLFCGTNSKQKFGAGTYHFEFRTPFQPKARGQGRGNSGVYICGKEIQVLDSFGLTGANNECGGYYGEAKPAVNMCYPPLRWQTYDVEIKADDKGILHSTVLHNGVKIHDNFSLKGKGPATINLQNHGNPVVYRNIWVVPAEK